MLATQLQIIINLDETITNNESQTIIGSLIQQGCIVAHNINDNTLKISGSSEQLHEALGILEKWFGV